MTKNTVSEIVTELSHGHCRRYVTLALKDLAQLAAMAFLCSWKGELLG